MKDESVINAISIDVEGFVESNRESFHVDAKYIDPDRENDEIKKNTAACLELLEEAGVKATFFIVGRIAYDIPEVVKQIADAGHEIGCHNYEHVRLFSTNKKEFAEKITIAKAKLEDVSGRRVFGYRAPEFSITSKTLWAVDALKETGFVYDSSVCPAGMHDVYGIENAEPVIHRFENGLIEFPMATTVVIGKRIPFGGGGYFRLYPLWLTKYFLSKCNKDEEPCMFYIHPYEIGPEIPKIRELSAYRKFRHYFHCKNGGKRVKKFLKNTHFASTVEVLRNEGYIEDMNVHE
ncbi:MAG: polysaccharide deacetylase [Planctomycetota bacterium]|nr:MAG: polysaccharide deacetylase [Planctomycetota bacterium]